MEARPGPKSFTLVYSCARNIRILLVLQVNLIHLTTACPQYTAEKYRRTNYPRLHVGVELFTLALRIAPHTTGRVKGFKAERYHVPQEYMTRSVNQYMLSESNISSVDGNTPAWFTWFDLITLLPSRRWDYNRITELRQIPRVSSHHLNHFKKVCASFGKSFWVKGSTTNVTIKPMTGNPSQKT